jgi:hypothetical protein
MIFTAIEEFRIGGKTVIVGMMENSDGSPLFVYAAARSNRDLEGGFCYYGCSEADAIATMFNELRGSDFFASTG